MLNDLISPIILTGIAVSYGWGMRGALIGGEKGAMLPGALLGLFLAKFSGIPEISDNTLIFSAIGCLGMGYGGFEPYAQTMEMVLHPKLDIFNPRRGYIGLMLKGCNWFGICGGILGIGFSALCSQIYTLYEIAAFFALIPFIQALGIKIFNKPFDKKMGIYPKIYFSRSSREEWGGNLLTLLMTLVFTVINGDIFSFFFCIVGMVSGAIGWAISIFLYDKTVHAMKNGKLFFGKAQANGYIDNWKIMEFSLGFLGGIGLAIYFFLNINTIKISDNSYSLLGEKENVIAIIAFTVTILLVSQYFIKKLQNSRFFELLERAIYFSLLLCICILGSTTMAQLVTLLLLLWVAVEKVVFDELGNSVKEKVIKAVYLLIFAVAVILELFLDFNDLMKILLYTYFYIISDFICICITPNRATATLKERLKGELTVHLWFDILGIILVVFIS